MKWRTKWKTWEKKWPIQLRNLLENLPLGIYKRNLTNCRAQKLLLQFVFKVLQILDESLYNHYEDFQGFNIWKWGLGTSIWSKCTRLRCRAEVKLCCNMKLIVRLDCLVYPTASQDIRERIVLKDCDIEQALHLVRCQMVHDALVYAVMQVCVKL